MNHLSAHSNQSYSSYCGEMSSYQYNQPMRVDQELQIGQNFAGQTSIVPMNYQGQPINEQYPQQVSSSTNMHQLYQAAQQQQPHLDDNSTYNYNINQSFPYDSHAYSSTQHQIPYMSHVDQMQAPHNYQQINSNQPYLNYQYNGLVMQDLRQDAFIHNQVCNFQHNQNILGQGEKFYTETVDQNSVFYSEQMDMHATIKQQEQEQQQQLLMTSNSNTLAPIASSTSSSSIPNMSSYSNPLGNEQSKGGTLNELQNLASLKSRSESDLELSNVKSVSSDSQTNIYRQNHQRSLSTILSYEEQQKQQLHSLNRELEQRQSDFVDLRSGSDAPQDWLDTICRHLIEHMEHFGICVIDNFLGSQKGESILKEVEQLYNSGQYSKGKLVSNKLNNGTLNADDSVIRNDRVIWIDGCENGCSEINNLIQTLCSVITNSSRLSLYSNNGLDKIVINKRTKAHVACYPGNGTRYIKHVDNPNGDGRVITSIYYLNKDWNTKRDGGMLRMFPVGIDEVANIEPLFDRALFFWSDRRNPHEVLPAYKDRFAITVWYIGESRSS